MSSGARIVLRVLAVVALVVGAVWVGQGANLIPGSSMTGDPTWLVIGLVLVVVAVVLLVVARRRP